MISIWWYIPPLSTKTTRNTPPWKSWGFPALTRAQLLGQMMRNYKNPVAVSGTHGKTTTTSMITEILLEAKARSDHFRWRNPEGYPWKYQGWQVRPFRYGRPANILTAFSASIPVLGSYTQYRRGSSGLLPGSGGYPFLLPQIRPASSGRRGSDYQRRYSRLP